MLYEDDGARGSALERPSVKHGLENTYNLRKLFGLLLFQPIIAFFSWVAISQIPTVKTWIVAHKSVFIATAVAQAVLPILVTAFRSTFRKPFLSFVSYVLFSSLLGYNVSYLVYVVDAALPKVVLAHLFFIYFALVLYTFATYTDLTYATGSLYIAIGVLVAYQTSMIMTDLSIPKAVVTSLIMIAFGFNLIVSSRLAVSRTAGQMTPPESPTVGALTIYAFTFKILLETLYNFAKIFKQPRL